MQAGVLADSRARVRRDPGPGSAESARRHDLTSFRQAKAGGCEDHAFVQRRRRFGAGLVGRGQDRERVDRPSSSNHVDSDHRSTRVPGRGGLRERPFPTVRDRLPDAGSCGRRRGRRSGRVGPLAGRGPRTGPGSGRLPRDHHDAGRAQRDHLGLRPSRDQCRWMASGARSRVRRSSVGGGARRGTRSRGAAPDGTAVSGRTRRLRASRGVRLSVSGYRGGARAQRSQRTADGPPGAYAPGRATAPPGRSGRARWTARSLPRRSATRRHGAPDRPAVRTLPSFKVPASRPRPGPGFRAACGASSGSRRTP